MKAEPTKRELALQWWRSMGESQQKVLAKSVFPDKEFFLISSSSSNIQRIWEKFKSN
jgi:hypothetical protein